MLDVDEERGNLQLEARPHIRIQEMIEGEFASGALADAARVDFILRLHREFYHEALGAMLCSTGGGRSFVIRPGTLRHDPQHDPQHDNAVGGQPPAAGQRCLREPDF